MNLKSLVYSLNYLIQFELNSRVVWLIRKKLISTNIHIVSVTKWACMLDSSHIHAHASLLIVGSIGGGVGGHVRAFRARLGVGVCGVLMRGEREGQGARRPSERFGAQSSRRLDGPDDNETRGWTQRPAMDTR
jgi:hypothetical protein